MIFWLLLAFTVIVVGVVFFRTLDEGIGAALGFALLGLIVAGGLSAVTMLILLATVPGATVISDTTTEHKLLTLQTAQIGEVHGTYYLRGGGIQGNSGTGYTFSYNATDENGSTYMQLDNSPADESRVYTDKNPRVDVRVVKWVWRNRLISPWDGGLQAYLDNTSYTFYVPEGSVIQDTYQAN